MIDVNCSTCDNYRFFEGADGMLERCEDCFDALHRIPICPAHGRRVNALGKCPECRSLAVAGELLFAAREFAKVGGALLSA